MQLHALALAALCGCVVTPIACAADLAAQLVDEQGRPLADAVLSLAASTPGPQAGTGVMDQRDKQFVPSVLAVRTGTSVTFPNSDNIRHHVYSFSPAKRFELRLYKGTPSEPVQFDTPGVVVLGCNIHDWMVGYVYVTDDPWFAVSDAQGQLAIDGLPAGSYRVKLWHPQLENMLPLEVGTLQLPQAQERQRFALPVGEVAPAPAPPKPSSFGEAFRKAQSEVQQ